MSRRRVKPDWEAVRNQSLEAVVSRGLVSERLVLEFKELESQMTKGGLLGGDFLESYQKSDDIYKRHLQRILKALRDIGEPHADEKMRAVIEELATMGPAGFLTPWEITLAYLDREYGDFDDVAEFYANKAS